VKEITLDVNNIKAAGCDRILDEAWKVVVATDGGI
jgi:hypothetical protein